MTDARVRPRPHVRSRATRVSGKTFTPTDLPSDAGTCLLRRCWGNGTRRGPESIPASFRQAHHVRWRTRRARRGEGRGRHARPGVSGAVLHRRKARAFPQASSPGQDWSPAPARRGRFFDPTDGHQLLSDSIPNPLGTHEAGCPEQPPGSVWCTWCIADSPLRWGMSWRGWSVGRGRFPPARTEAEMWKCPTCGDTVERRWLFGGLCADETAASASAEPRPRPAYRPHQEGDVQGRNQASASGSLPSPLMPDDRARLRLRRPRGGLSPAHSRGLWVGGSP